MIPNKQHPIDETRLFFDERSIKSDKSVYL